MEELYPFPLDRLAGALASYRSARESLWVQEEPQNMGAWNFVSRRIPADLSFGRAVRYVGRPESSSPASGSRKEHEATQAGIVGAAFS
jgi:2-oxoglutarate dehydrogenase E1 component